MSRFILLIVIFLAACTGSVKNESSEAHSAENRGDSLISFQRDNGKKWKADSATKHHVATMQRLVNDVMFNNPKAARELASELKRNVNLLVKDCSMKGADHDALHVWLEALLENIKALEKEEADEYAEVRQKIQQHIAGFYDVFE